MRRSVTISLGALVVLGTLTAGTVADAGTNSSPSDRRSLSLTSTDGPSADMDHNAPGPGMGDMFAYLNPLLQNGKVIGQEAGQCTVMQFTSETDPVLFNCINTLELKDGSITTMILAHSDAVGPSFAAITGGTGAYRGSSGQVKVSFVDGVKHLDFEFS
jgi:hypothetical protein